VDGVGGGRTQNKKLVVIKWVEALRKPRGGKNHGLGWESGIVLGKGGVIRPRRILHLSFGYLTTKLKGGVIDEWKIEGGS